MIIRSRVESMVGGLGQPAKTSNRSAAFTLKQPDHLRSIDRIYHTAYELILWDLEAVSVRSQRGCQVYWV